MQVASVPGSLQGVYPYDVTNLYVTLANKKPFIREGRKVIPWYHPDFRSWAVLVDLRGFEPLTSSMPWRRSPSCATGPGKARVCAVFDLLSLYAITGVPTSAQYFRQNWQNSSFSKAFTLIAHRRV